VENAGRPYSGEFGLLLRRYRIAAGLSQEELAERAGMSANGVGALERGYRRGPQRDTLELLVEALGLSAEQRRALAAAAARPSVPRRRADTSVTQGPWPAAPAAAALPLALTSFIGRTTELAEIEQLLRDRRFVTITGAGGVGKTQTALRVADVLQRERNATVCFVGFASLREPRLAAAAVSAAVGVQAVPRRPPLETLIAALERRSALLIFDNCEHVLAEVTRIVEALLQRCSGVRILATSREPFKCAGERVLRLPSLDAQEAAALFLDRARAVDARLHPGGPDARLIAEICRRLDGIPLAIELAAAHLNVLSVAAIARNLNDRFRILTGGERTAVPRQRTMRAAIDWSYALLTPAEQRLFERLSVFVGKGTQESVAAVCAGDDLPEGDVLDTLSSLIDKSLVVADLHGDEPRFGMLESFREYARDRLASRGELTAVAHRHAQAYLHCASWFNRAFDREPAPVVRERGGYDSGDWRAALRWTLGERADVVLGQRLAGELGPYFSFFLATARNTFFFGHEEGRRWLAAALGLLQPETPAASVAALHYARARIAGSLQEYRAELESSEIALDRFEEVGDALGTVRAQAALAHALIYTGGGARARGIAENAVMQARGLGERSRFTLACLLRLRALASDDLFAARRDIAEALETHAALSHESSYAAALLDLAECECRAGNLDAALAHAERSLAVAPAGNAFAQCSALHAASAYLTALNRPREALPRANQALEIAGEYRFSIYAAWALEQLAVLAGPLPQSARTLGFTGARIGALGSARLPFLQPQYERLRRMLDIALGADAVADLIAAGAAMTEERAIDDFLITR
jgi:predicted ATPase/DNA-binding XRE family transcriptional regulator